jgi:ATP-binding cassette, subfamily F, member 3
VSHDRDFLHGLTNRLLEVKDGRLRDHHMDILELIERNKALVEEMNATKKQVAAKPAAPVVKNDDRGARKEQEKELRRLKNQVQKCEQELAKLEQEQKDLQAGLSNGSLDTERMEEAYTRLGELATLIDACMREWERAGSELEAVQKEVA